MKDVHNSDENKFFLIHSIWTKNHTLNKNYNSAESSHIKIVERSFQIIARQLLQ
jgi:hypothetical protein